MKKTDPAFRARLSQAPADTVRVIVRVKGERERALQRLRQLECTVRYVYALLPAVALSCSASVAVALLDEPWVEALEEDRQVSAQTGDVHDSR